MIHEHDTEKRFGFYGKSHYILDNSHISRSILRDLPTYIWAGKIVKHTDV